MNWTALLSTILAVFEKNPELAQTLLTVLLNLFASNPALLAKAVHVGLAHAEAALPPTTQSA